MAPPTGFFYFLNPHDLLKITETLWTFLLSVVPFNVVDMLAPVPGEIHISNRRKSSGAKTKTRNTCTAHSQYLKHEGPKSGSETDDYVVANAVILRLLLNAINSFLTIPGHRVSMMRPHQG